jgi:hypothetical protein
MNGMNGPGDAADYRAELVQELGPHRTIGLGPRSIGRLMGGYAEQIRREDAARRADHYRGNGSVDHRVVLTEALVAKGYAPYRAAMLVAEFTEAVAGKAVRDSDHESYRVLADAVSEVIHKVSDADDWDGDDSEEYLLTQFIAWLPDIVRHADAEKLRERAPSDGSALYGAADDIDPFERSSRTEGLWIRKSDGEIVPWPVVKE